MILAPLILGLVLSQATQPWTVNENHTILWDGKPYIPVGARIEGNVDAVAQAQSAGVSDLIVELPADGTGWDAVIAKLNQGNSRYMICLTSSAPQPRVWDVEPQGYRVPGIEGPFDFRIAFPDSSNVLCALVNSRDADVRWTRTIQVTDGTIRIADPAGPSTAHVLLMYPQVRDMRIPDYWEGFDAHRDQLLRLLNTTKFGPGFRGLIDPLGKSVQFAAEKLTFVPMSSMFKVELETYLTQKYGAVPTVLRAWGFLAPTLETFKDLSRVIPLWSERKGIPGFYDPLTKQIYRVNEKNSNYWVDIQAVIRATAERRYRRLVESINKVLNVPVIEDWKGWDGPYTQVNPTVPGIGIEMNYDNLLELTDGASRPMSTVLDRGAGSFAVATDLNLNPALDSVWASLVGAGVRGAFFRTSSAEGLRAVATLANSRNDDNSVASWSPKAFYYPESARNPASPSLLAGGYSWLPSPKPGQKISFGYGIEGYRIDGPDGGYVAYWSVDQPKRVHFKLQDPKVAIFESLDGSDLNPKVLKNKELEITIPTSPVIFRGSTVPVPSECFAASALLAQSMIKLFALSADVSGTESLTLKDIMNGFDRDPYTAFMSLRQQYEKMLIRAAPYRWIEAERSTNQTMSAVEDVAGCSGGRVLTLNTKLPPILAGFQANYSFTMPQNQTCEVWIAAKIPKALRPTIRVSLPGQTGELASPPVSFYGQGYGWYKVGNFDVTRKPQTLTVECLSRDGANLSLDAIVVIQPGFRPDGVNLPEDYVAAELRKPPPKKGSSGDGNPPPKASPARHKVQD